MRMTILAGLIVGVSLAFQSAHGAQARNKGGQAAAVVHPRRFRARRLPQQEALARRGSGTVGDRLALRVHPKTEGERMSFTEEFGYLPPELVFRMHGLVEAPHNRLGSGPKFRACAILNSANSPV